MAAPALGFAAVLLRFVPTSLAVPLPLFLLGRTPFQQPYLSFLPSSSAYYLLEALWLPLFGIAAWLLMGGLAHTAVRLAGAASRFDVVLNVVGLGMLAPMPLVWTWDATMIATGGYTVVVMAVSHTVAQAWEAAVEAVGFRRLAGWSWRSAAGAAVAVNVVYVLAAMLVVR